MDVNFVILCCIISFVAGGNADDLELKMANVVSIKIRGFCFSRHV